MFLLLRGRQVLAQHRVDEPFTGSSTLLRGSGFFRFAGTGHECALATVFRDTLYR